MRKRTAFSPSGRAICDREVGGCAAGAYAVLSEEPIPCLVAGDFFFGWGLNLKEARGMRKRTVSPFRYKKMYENA